MNIPVCTSIKDIWQQPKKCYWPIKHKLAIIDGPAIKSIGIIPFITETNTGTVAEQPYEHQIDETLLGRELVYWLNINAVIKSTMNWCATCLEYPQTQPQVKTIPDRCYASCWRWLVLISFLSKIKKNLCIVDHYSKLPIVKQKPTVSQLMTWLKNLDFLKNILSYAGMNFTSDTFRQFCRKIIIKQTIRSSCHNTAMARWKCA